MEIIADQRRGHIALVRGRETVVTFTSLGTVLQIWQYDGGVELDHVEARRLGAALIEWANERVRIERRARSAEQAAS